MSKLQTLGAGQGYLKAGFLGFPKSGKTFTAAKLAIGTRELFNLKGPIAMFDTEGGAEYVAAMIRKETGLDLMGVRARSLVTLLETGRECEASGVSVFIADSITHPWRELCESYLKQINEVRKAKNRSLQTRLEFQDWNPIKAKWAEWTDFYLNSKLHIIICGRAGFEWDFEERADGSGKDLIKTGIKMKTEGEFGFEPSLLVEMERIQDRREGKDLIHRATVLGDRFDAIDGATMDNPGFDFFRPHLEMLVAGAHAGVDTKDQTDFGVEDDGSSFDRERKIRVILCEKIQAAMIERWPGQTTKEKQAKVAVLFEAFGTKSWTEVETRISLETLKSGLALIEAKSAEVEA